MVRHFYVLFCFYPKMPLKSLLQGDDKITFEKKLERIPSVLRPWTRTRFLERDCKVRRGPAGQTDKGWYRKEGGEPGE